MSRPIRALPGCLLVLVALACALATPADARTPAATSSPAGAPPKAWIIVDADSGAVIDASNPHASLPPASTVKLMTAVTALQTLPMSAPLTVSARAAGVPSRKINMQAGELWNVDNTIKSLLLVSANDAAYTLAENASGSLERFAATMNQTSKKLGLRDSHFGDPAGLDNDQGFGFGDMMSAFDLAVVARNALSVPELAQSMTLQKFEFTGPGNIGHVIKNENLMLSLYPGATGMKTGFTDKAGRTLVASATRDGRTMIAVVLGYFDTYKFAQGLLDAGFRSAPNARGTGEKIPAPRVLTAQARADAWGNLPRALGRADAAGAQVLAATQTATPPSSRPRSRAAAGSARRRASSASATKTPATRTGASGSGWLSLPRLIAAGLLALVALLLLRRRAVKRRRKRRLALQRDLEQARRRGMIQVLEPPMPQVHVEVIRPAGNGQNGGHERERESERS
jgi:D-alanyl-D-alanine carboxypeptidase